MIITAWIILSCIIVFILIQTILLIANAKYREKVSTIFEKWRSVLIASIMIVILSYTLGTCALIILFGDCYVGYYGSEGTETLYYDGSWYYQIADSNFTIISDFYEYGNGHWICTNTYISQAPVDFPYFEYWDPPTMHPELEVPGELEPLYLRVWETDSRCCYYVREDIQIKYVTNGAD